MRGTPRTKAKRRGSLQGWQLRRSVAFAVLALLLGLFMITAVAVAKDKDQQKSKPEKAVYRDEHPTMSFLRGALSRDSLGHWKVDGTMVWFTAQTHLWDQERPDAMVSPRDGRTYILMGHRQGANFVVRNGVDVTGAELRGNMDLSSMSTTGNLQVIGDGSIAVGEQPE